MGEARHGEEHGSQAGRGANTGGRLANGGRRAVGTPQPSRTRHVTTKAVNDMTLTTRTVPDGGLLLVGVVRLQLHLQLVLHQLRRGGTKEARMRSRECGGREPSGLERERARQRDQEEREIARWGASRTIRQAHSIAMQARALEHSGIDCSGHADTTATHRNAATNKATSSNNTMQTKSAPACSPSS